MHLFRALVDTSCRTLSNSGQTESFGKHTSVTLIMVHWVCISGRTLKLSWTVVGSRFPFSEGKPVEGH